MIASAFLFVKWVAGVAFLGALLFMLYIVAQVYLYFKNDYFMKPKWEIINKVLAVLLVLFAGVFSAFSDDLAVFEGVSYSMSVLLAILWFYAIFQFFRDFMEIEQRPVFYSPQLFPIYKYNPSKYMIEEHYAPTASWALGIVILLIWAFYVNFHIFPSWAGCVISIGVEQLAILGVIYLRSVTLESVDRSIGYMNEETVKSSWLSAKETYVRGTGAFSRGEINTYKKDWLKRHALRMLYGKINNVPLEKAATSTITNQC
jgi:hypothetical protein